MELLGNVLVRQDLRPAIREVPAVNRRGVPFPEQKRVLMRVRGDFHIAIDDLVLRADEADIDGLTGEMQLRGNVKLSRERPQ